MTCVGCSCTCAWPVIASDLRYWMLKVFLAQFVCAPETEYNII